MFGLSLPMRSCHCSDHKSIVRFWTNLKVTSDKYFVVSQSEMSHCVANDWCVSTSAEFKEDITLYIVMYRYLVYY